jgi:hypoxanthine phosphoribosyltransferase
MCIIQLWKQLGLNQSKPLLLSCTRSAAIVMTTSAITSMPEVTIKDKTFSISIPSEKIQERVSELAKQINTDYAGCTPVILGVLNGAVFFTVDLFRQLTIECELSFMRVASYHGGLNTSGSVTGVIGIKEELAGRHVLLVEDIVDTGLTASYLISEVSKLKPASLKLATALFKPTALKTSFTPDYTGFEVNPDFLVGYGLDYDGLGRNLNDIYVLKPC